MNINECKSGCKYLEIESSVDESFYVCVSPKTSSSFPEFEGKCPYFEKVINENKHIKNLIEFIQEYIESDMSKYEACYLTREDLQLIIKALKEVVKK
ncbi:hypothetical protein [uncultured Eubacterium sp.]|uniref:hypothetical protein n=1 Tax=uncultured Eubacterium sp. TaxID=165185 RepID=UPI00259AD705|nr:hypothetical protein [uncultured Eubacterium sp.]